MATFKLTLEYDGSKYSGWQSQINARTVQGELQTVAESGLPGFASEDWQGILAPAKTPPAIVNRLSESLKAALALEETKRSFDAAGGVPEHVPPDVLAVRIRDGVPRWATIARQSGAQP